MLRVAVAIGAIYACALPYGDLNEDDPLSPNEQKLLEEQDAFATSLLARAIKRNDLEYLIDDEGYRPLHLAAQHGDVDTVRELLRLGADANARLTDLASFRATPLHVAAEWGRVNIVR